MRKFVLALFVAILMVGLTLSAQAGKKDKTPLTTITFTSECENDGISFLSADEDTISATWTATPGEQTKYGGDIKFKVFGVTKDELAQEDKIVEIGLMLADDIVPMGTYGRFLYECLTGITGPCDAELANLQLAISNDIDDQSGAAWAWEKATFLGIFIKGMNPGVGDPKTKRQNYEQEICGFYEVPEEEVEEPTSE